MKQKGIWLLATELALTCILIGCECGPIVTRRKRLKLLEAGMTKAQVLEIMGRPYERAAYSNSEWLVYQTEWDKETDDSPFGVNWIEKPDNEWLTPLLFRDGKLVGIDKDYWDKYKFRALK